MNIPYLIKELFLHPTRLIEAMLRKKAIAIFLSDKTALNIFYYLRFHKFPNLKSPATFNEKLLWLTLHDRRPIYNIMVDKYEAKSYITEILHKNGKGTDSVVPNLGVYTTFDEIDFAKLPDKFVMKTTHDSGGVVVVSDKSKLNLNTSKIKLEKSLRNNYFWFSREWAYRDIKPRILIEKYIESGGIVPPDYKIYCFNGKPEFCLYVSGRFNEVREDFFDLNWARLPFTRGGHLNSVDTPQRPHKFNEMIELARILSSEYPFLRVDFFIDRFDHIYIGELTLTPASGLQAFEPQGWDKIWGQKLILPQLNGENDI